MCPGHDLLQQFRSTDNIAGSLQAMERQVAILYLQLVAEGLDLRHLVRLALQLQLARCQRLLQLP
jgi:hypothetical protein